MMASRLQLGTPGFHAISQQIPSLGAATKMAGAGSSVLAFHLLKVDRGGFIDVDSSSSVKVHVLHDLHLFTMLNSCFTMAL